MGLEDDRSEDLDPVGDEVAMLSRGAVRCLGRTAPADRAHER